MKIDLAITPGVHGREDTQWYTQGLAATLLSVAPMPNRLWLDVGAGLGLSKQRIDIHGFLTITQDPAPELKVDISRPVDRLIGQYGVVSAFDVVEHTKDVEPFLAHLRRLSGKYTVISIPFDAPSDFHETTFNAESLLSMISLLGKLVCAYELGDGWVARRDYRPWSGGFGGLLICES